MGVTDVVQSGVRDFEAANRAGGIVHEDFEGRAQAAFPARACGAIPREHAEPGHEEVRASEIEIGRKRASERARA